MAKINISKMQELKDVCTELNLISVYDTNCYSFQELYYKLANKLNELIIEIKRFEGYVDDEVTKQTEILDNLLQSELADQVIMKLNEWLADGTMDTLINYSVFNGFEKRLQTVEKITRVVEGDIKEFFNTIEDGETILIKGDFTVDQIKLNEKNNVTLLFDGLIKQQPTVTDTYTYEHCLSNQPLLVIKRCENITIKNYKCEPVHEGVYIEDSSGQVLGGKIDGLGTSKFNGFHIYHTSKTYKGKLLIDGMKVVSCGTMPVWDSVNNKNPFAMGGHGIHLSSAKYVTITNCLCEENAMNGIFLFASRDVSILNNIIENNGMSGIQIAFGGSKDMTQNYRIIGNSILNNYADGLDINNNTGDSRIIELVLEGNLFKNNGFMNGNVTQDGSGIATLVGVGGCSITGNRCFNSARTGIFIVNCEDIVINGNTVRKSNNIAQLVYINNSSFVTINGNNFYGSGEGIKLDRKVENITIKGNNIFASCGLVLPNETEYFLVSASENTITSGMTINAVIDLINNNLNCTSTTNDVLIVSGQLKRRIIGNKINNGYRGILVQSSSYILIKDNDIISNDMCIQVNGNSIENIIEGNYLQNLTNVANLIISNSTVENTKIKENIMVSTGGNALRLEPSNCGTVYLDNNVVAGDGINEYGNGIVYEIPWSNKNA